MGTRLELHDKLIGLLGNSNVYFQPPASVKLSYPCVIYNIGSGDAIYANDKIYKFTNSYDIIFIYKRPNQEIIEQVLNELPMSRFSRYYTSDNLNHYAFNLYY